MRLLFVMDPATSMLPDKDTTFAFVRSAGSRGHTCFTCLPRDLDAHTPAVPGASVTVIARCQPFSVSDVAPHVSVGAPTLVDLAEFDAVFIRKDPPFDTVYLHLTQVLDLVSDRTLIVNSPSGLRAANEKLFALRFSRWMPRTLVSRNRDAILQFLSDVGGRAVLKPLDGAGGSGVVGLTTGDKNVRALIDILTSEGNETAMVQEFQPGITEGDKRVLLLDGKSIGAILRVPRADDIRANIHVGGTVVATTLTPAEEELVADVGPILSKHGLYFVGLDLIGGKLIEVNVTSPTGIQELGRHTGSRPEDQVLAWVEGRA